MDYNFQVENIKCGGCANTITTKLKEIEAVEDVIVNVDEQQVTVIAGSGVQDDIKSTLGKKLAKLGYPEVGSAGPNRMVAKATSFVSCAIGKVSGKR